MLHFSDQLGQPPNWAYQFGIKECNEKGRELWMESDEKRLKVECCTEAYVYPKILLVEFWVYEFFKVWMIDEETKKT